MLKNHDRTTWSNEKMADEGCVIPKEIKETLGKYYDVFEVINEGKKLKCHLTCHEIPLTSKSVKDYIGGKKFQRLFDKLKSPETFVSKVEARYKEFFIPSKSSKSRLYCTLTKKEVNNLPHAIEKYTRGYKFMKALHLHKEKILKGEITGNNNNNDDPEKDETDEDCCDDPFYALSDEEYPDDIDMTDNQDEMIEEEEKISNDFASFETVLAENSPDCKIEKYVIEKGGVDLEENLKDNNKGGKKNKKRKNILKIEKVKSSKKKKITK